ncbi:MAG: hypothetical protein K0S65_4095 [Labilithrix sp.]|nr:hypothetical protein [Labilithrix sp.]
MAFRASSRTRTSSGDGLAISAEHEDGDDENGGDDNRADDLLDLSVHSFAFRPGSTEATVGFLRPMLTDDLTTCRVSGKWPDRAEKRRSFGEF